VTFGGIVDVAIDSAGRILVVDHVDQVVRIFDSQGRKAGVMGGPGEGPGEFRLPYRIAIAPDGMVYVFDQYQGRLSEFDRELRFIRSLLLQPTLTAADLAVTADAIVMTGIDRLSRTDARVIHVFGRSDGVRQRAFGRLLPARSPEVAREVGPGPFAIASDGRIWYATPGPYAIEVYARTGERELVLDRPNDFLPPAEDGFSLIASEGRVRMRVNPQAAMLAMWHGAGSRLYVMSRLLDERIVVDEFRAGDDGGRTVPVLVRSSVSAMPLLYPERMISPDTYLISTRDADGVRGLAKVRVRSGFP